MANRTFKELLGEYGSSANTVRFSSRTPLPACREPPEALEELPANIQAVTIAYFGKEMTQEEVAKRFKVSECTVRNWISQGLD